MYDIIVVGAGPAGITAAVYAARKKLKTAIISKNIGGQAALSSDIENYTGFQFISGPELAIKFEEHLKQFDLDLRENTEILSIEKKGEVFYVKLENEVLETRTVILANGTQPRNLNVPGEEEYKNRGITYCATCDAPLFSGKDVVVVGGGNSGLDAVLQLTAIAHNIYLIERESKLLGDKILVETVEQCNKVEILTNTIIEKIEGSVFVEKVTIKTEGKEAQTLNVQGIFIEIGYQPVVIPVTSNKGELNLTEWGEIDINCRCETSIPGLFAAGDITNVPFKQIIAAAGQGCIACLSAFEYLTKNKFMEN